MKLNVYSDENENRLEFHLNVEDKLYLQVSNTDLQYGWIVLNKEDISNLIKDLQSLYNVCYGNE